MCFLAGIRKSLGFQTLLYWTIINVIFITAFVCIRTQTTVLYREQTEHTYVYTYLKFLGTIAIKKYIYIYSVVHQNGEFLKNSITHSWENERTMGKHCLNAAVKITLFLGLSGMSGPCFENHQSSTC